MKKTKVPWEDRQIRLAQNTAYLPERLLLSHGMGRTLLITGAGTSMASGLPSFRRLVLEIYRELDNAIFELLSPLAPQVTEISESDQAHLSFKQRAEVKRFLSGEYDVALGMLDRRMDNPAELSSKVRTSAINQLRRIKDNATGLETTPKPSALHKALIRLSDRGGSSTIATTNFDLLLEAAVGSKRMSSYSLGAIPRPGRRGDFQGILHIHGAMSKSVAGRSEIIVTDRDFGEFYLRRRVVPDFIYDAARLFNLVLVGYSANDAPMRYLLNAVAADGSRFTDLKERFAFVGMTTPFREAELEDWRGRGITPIPYAVIDDSHDELMRTLVVWSKMSAINGPNGNSDRVIKRLVKISRSASPDEDRDLFDHLYRRGNPTERARFSALVSKANAEVAWLDAMSSIDLEPSVDL